MATRIRPLADRLIVKRVDDQEQKSAGGIIIPDTAKEKPQEGKVVAVGRGKLSEEGKVIPLDVKAGDRILFGKYSAPRSRSMARSTSSCVRKTSSASSRPEKRRRGEEPCQQRS